MFSAELKLLWSLSENPVLMIITVIQLLCTYLLRMYKGLFLGHCNFYSFFPCLLLTASDLIS